MKIQWNKVTWYSKFVAIIIFVGTFVWAFYLGQQYEQIAVTAMSSDISSITEKMISKVAFACDAGKTINAQFLENSVGQGAVAIALSDGRSMTLPQTISADGGRYATVDESFIFWTKGNGAFIEEGKPYATTTPPMTYKNCVTK